MAKRSNVWAFIVYPGDSCPDEYVSIVNGWHIPALISPVHDMDLNADESEKKKHVHIMLYFGKGSNKSLDQVKEYSEQLHGTMPIIVNNTNAMIRYFIHFDNPEKHKYSKADLISLSGFEIDDAFESYTNDSMYFDFLEEYIAEKGIYNFFILVMNLKQDNFLYELDFLRRHTIYFRTLLDHRYHLVETKKSDS